MKNTYISIGLLVALVATIFTISNIDRSKDSVSLATTTVVATAHIEAPVKAETHKTTVSPTPTATPTPKPADNVSLLVASSTYRTHIDGSMHVLDLMNTLSSATDFAFTGEDYPSLGFFVESVNGRKGGNGLYWILYVNGKSSDLGASAAIIKPGDTVEWRLEKGN